MKRYNEKKLKILITANLEKVLLSQKKRTKYSIMDSQIYSNIKIKCGKNDIQILKCSSSQFLLAFN